MSDFTWTVLILGHYLMIGFALGVWFVKSIARSGKSVSAEELLPWIPGWPILLIAMVVQRQLKRFTYQLDEETSEALRTAREKRERKGAEARAKNLEEWKKEEKNEHPLRTF